MKDIQFFVWRKDTLLGVFKTYDAALHCFTVESNNRIRAIITTTQVQLRMSHRGEDVIVPPDIERINTSGVLTIVKVFLDDGYVMDQHVMNVVDKSADHESIRGEITKQFVSVGNEVPAWQHIGMTW
jgi:hypothetical protein